MVVAARNLILVVACVQALRRLWQSGAREPQEFAETVKAPASAAHTS